MSKQDKLWPIPDVKLMVTEFLEKAFSEAAKLSPEAQDMLAPTLLDDLVAEEKWDETIATSQDKLSALADEALAEYKADETKRLEEIL